jgi:hypothetical protein
MKRGRKKAKTNYRSAIDVVVVVVVQKSTSSHNATLQARKHSLNQTQPMVKNLLRKHQDATALPDNRAETGKIQTFVSKITRNGNTRETPCKPLAPSDTSVFSSAMTLHLQ